MPYECEHGLILDWGDFGDDRTPEHCDVCQPYECGNCERCRWQPDADCGIAEHPQCERCGHCRGRHGSWVTNA
jgi:hypothetical protein